MISLEEALEKILSSVKRLQAEEKPLLECLDQVLDEDVYAGFDIPPYDNAAMDGYAVRAADTAAALAEHPVYLKVIGEEPAGHPSLKKVAAGTAMRIMTGAPVPAGADAVVRFEHTDELDPNRTSSRDRIGIFVPASRALNIRPRGEDITNGSLVLKRGTILKAAEIGVLASLGKAGVSVVRRPIVAILPTGDELCRLDEPLAPGKIYDSNSYALAASVLKCGGVPRILEIARDSPRPLEEQIGRGADADLLITSGGVSMGDYDIVKEVLARMGSISFWTVRMKPGKPLAFGLIRNPRTHKEVPHLGLPGNPVSSMITFEQFARPAILKMMGRSDFARPTVLATLDQSITNDDGRRVFARVRLVRHKDGWHAALTGGQGSGILTSMTAANGLAIVPEDRPEVKAGEMVTVQLLDGAECQS